MKKTYQLSIMTFLLCSVLNIEASHQAHCSHRGMQSYTQSSSASNSFATPYINRPTDQQLKSPELSRIDAFLQARAEKERQAMRSRQS